MVDKIEKSVINKIDSMDLMEIARIFNSLNDNRRCFDRRDLDKLRQELKNIWYNGTTEQRTTFLGLLLPNRQ